MRQFFIIMIACTLITCMGYFLYNVNSRIINYTDQGKIVAKSSDEVAIKRGTITELYLCIEFEKGGFKALNVDPTTYFRHKIGDTVAFDLRKNNPEILWIPFFTGAVCAFVCASILAAIFISWLIGIIPEKS